MVAKDQSYYVLASLGREVRGLKDFKPHDPAPYINCRPYGLLVLLVGVYRGDDPRQRRDQREVEAAIRWTLKELKRRGSITIHCDPDGFMAGVWLGAVPRRDRVRRKIAVNDRAIVLARDGYACVLCGREDDLTLDHIFPFALGGSDDPVNLRVLCRQHNSRKGADVPDAIRLLGLRRPGDEESVEG